MLIFKKMAHIRRKSFIWGTLLRGLEVHGQDLLKVIIVTLTDSRPRGTVGAGSRESLLQDDSYYKMPSHFFIPISR